jgi:hypothetical protein
MNYFIGGAIGGIQTPMGYADEPGHLAGLGLSGGGHQESISDAGLENAAGKAFNKAVEPIGFHRYFSQGSFLDMSFRISNETTTAPMVAPAAIIA